MELEGRAHHGAVPRRSLHGRIAARPPSCAPALQRSRNGVCTVDCRHLFCVAAAGARHQASVLRMAGRRNARPAYFIGSGCSCPFAARSHRRSCTGHRSPDLHSCVGDVPLASHGKRSHARRRRKPLSRVRPATTAWTGTVLCHCTSTLAAQVAADKLNRSARRARPRSSRVDRNSSYAAFLLDFFALFFFGGFGTFAPAFRASERPMAMACLRLVTFFLLRPLFSFPSFIARISRSTDFDAAAPYLRLLAF